MKSCDPSFSLSGCYYTLYLSSISQSSSLCCGQIQATPKGASLTPLALHVEVAPIGAPLESLFSPNVPSGAELLLLPPREPSWDWGPGRGSAAPSGCSSVVNSPAGWGTARASLSLEMCCVFF